MLEPDSGESRDVNSGDMTRGGVAASAALHVIVAALVVFGVPNLFRKPPPQEMPIAVQLVTIAPETRATQPNPFRPRPDAKPEPPLAEPAPIPEPKPEPPVPSPAPPPLPPRRPHRLRRRSPRRNRFLPIRRPWRKPSRNRCRLPAAAAEAGRSTRAARPAAGSGA